MTSLTPDGYVRSLDRELRRRGVTDAAMLEETREHLADAVARARQSGLSLADAEREAIGRFGAPETVAARCAEARFRRSFPLLLMTAVVAGRAVAYVDSRSTWDDTGITAGALVILSGLLGLAGPRRPWVWALGVGIWIPAYAIVRAPSWSAMSMLLVLAFPLAGAYLGAATRRLALAVPHALD